MSDCTGPADGRGHPYNQPVTALVTFGCRHEHITTRLVCDECAATLTHGGGYCYACSEAVGAQHRCRLRVIAQRPAGRGVDREKVA